MSNSYYAVKETIRNNIYWLLGKSSKLSLDNTILIYKVIAKPVWNPAMGIGCCKKYSHFQSKILRIITNARTQILERELNIPSVHDEIKNISTRYTNRLCNHINPLAAELAVTNRPSRRLHRWHPIDLQSRF